MRRVSRYRVPSRSGPSVSFSTTTPAGSHSIARSTSFVSAKTFSIGAWMVSTIRISTTSALGPDVLRREDDVVEPDAVLRPRLRAFAPRRPVRHVVGEPEPVDVQLLHGSPTDASPPAGADPVDPEGL